MAGLLNPAAASPSSSSTPQAQSAQVGDEEGMEPNVTAEEQAQYERFVHAGFDLIYTGNRVRPSIMKLLDDDPKDLLAVLPKSEDIRQDFNPVIALGATAAIVTLEVVRRAKEQYEDAVIFHGGQALLEDLAQIAVKAGIHDYSDEDVSQAFRVGADIYREAGTAEGLVDENQLKAEFGQIVAAEKEGRLAQLMPQFAGIADEGEGSAGAADQPATPAPSGPSSMPPAGAAAMPEEEEQRA